jgi:hypothetical protein
MSFSDYIIYADESGSPVLTADQHDFPIFVLVFLIIEKTKYCGSLVPALQRLKFEFVGHDQLVLHERDIRRQSGAFAFLQVSQKIRERFMEEISKIVVAADFHLACTIIDKTRLSAKYTQPWSPYDLALTFTMEKAANFLVTKKQTGREVNVVFEARGAKEDDHLTAEFFRIASGRPKLGRADPFIAKLNWKPIFADKRSNSAGLQIADLAARPLGLRYLRPNQKNHSVEVLEPKLLLPSPKVFP